jgi:glucosamine kinase
MSFVLGLDSGGSKTLAAVADERGTILRRWQGPGFDPQRVPDWEALLAEAVASLCEDSTPAAAVLGLPMHGEIEALSQQQRTAADALFPSPHLVLNDVEVAFDGAFPGMSGVLVLAGTGSMAWAKVNGESLRVGGWGDAFGDEGSAFWIGREALSLASQALDGRRRDAPEFASGILAACGTTAETLVDWAYGQENFRSAVANLAKEVDVLAEAGDKAAIWILRSAAAMLATHVHAVRRKPGCASLNWSHAGSVFRSRTVIDRLAALLGEPVAPRLPPVGGALWRAAELAGWRGDERFIASLSACLSKT